jgi:N-sulfoglucosamine sulfohydrolase
MGRRYGELNRRRFLQVASGSAAVALLPKGSAWAEEGREKSRPNFLWISTEDINPDLGCYGDQYAVTPNLDRLAGQGVRYTNVFTHAGVCAPSRSGVITGAYPVTIGTHHMRCQGVPPHYIKCFTEHLRAAGYYCTNNVKTDYQFDAPLTAWDECSNKAHWRNRPKGKPFFSVINFTITHESQIRNRSEQMLKRLDGLSPAERHDPAQAVLPPYYPDTPVVRQDWAQYYDIVTLMDKQVQEVLDQLEADGLAEDTIVWFWGDHGRGLPRAKRWVYDSGTHVPLILRIPEKWRKPALPENPEGVKPGTVNEDLIGFVDFAPTMLSLTGIEIPKYMPGRAFLGRQKAPLREYVLGCRDRMDEAYDVIRTARDKRFRYIRNLMWHVSRAQHIDYMDQMPTMREMRRLYIENKLQGPQMQFFEPTKPVEELYDTTADPHEVNNLAGDPKYKDVLERMRQTLNDWCRARGDLGLIPEPIFDELKRPGGKFEKTADPVVFKQTGNPNEGGAVTVACSTQGASIAWRVGGDPKSATGWELYAKPVRLGPGEVLYARACRLGFQDSEVVAFKLGDPTKDKPEPTQTRDWEKELEASNVRARLWKLKEADYRVPNAVDLYLPYVKDGHPAVRYWAAVGLHANCRYPIDVGLAKPVMTTLLNDPSPTVRVAAAHALCDWGDERAGVPVLIEALQSPTDKTRLLAVIALDKIDVKARPACAAVKVAADDRDEYVKRVAKTLLPRLEPKK